MIVKCGNQSIKVAFCGVDRETLEKITGEEAYPHKICFNKNQLNILAEQMGAAVIGTDRFDEVLHSQLNCLNKWKEKTKDPCILEEINEYIASNSEMLSRSKEVREKYI